LTKSFPHAPILNDKKRKSATRKYINTLKIKTPSERARISGLSGGNQQKVILSRWLLTSPDILLLDEPTRGIDVLAKYEIYTLIRDLAKSGTAVIVVSSEMSELLGISDRIAVMSGGRIAGEVSPKHTSSEEILTLAGKFI
jgi:methyl-galactoside transport system ATP-binding protein